MEFTESGKLWQTTDLRTLSSIFCATHYKETLVVAVVEQADLPFLCSTRLGGTVLFVFAATLVTLNVHNIRFPALPALLFHISHCGTSVQKAAVEL